MLSVLAFVLGLVVGALTAHVAETVMTKRPWEAPRCPYCTAPYSPLQWSATLGLLTGQWRCQECAKPQRWPRIIGEGLLALSWALLVMRYGATLRVLYAMGAVVPLVMIIVTDLETKLIPNRIILPATGVLLVLGTLLGPPLPFAKHWTWWHALAGGVLGFAVFWLLANVGIALFGEGALGAGDVKLAAYVGLVTGFPYVITALLLAFVLGGIGAALVLIARRGSLKTAIPYGPFIALGAMVTLIWGMEIAFWFLG